MKHTEHSFKKKSENQPNQFPVIKIRTQMLHLMHDSRAESET